MPQYLCIRECYHGKIRFKPGDMENFPKDYSPPRHFIPVDPGTSPKEKAQILDRAAKADLEAIKEKRVKIKAQKRAAKEAAEK